MVGYWYVLSMIRFPSFVVSVIGLTFRHTCAMLINVDPKRNKGLSYARLDSVMDRTASPIPCATRCEGRRGPNRQQLRR